MKATQLTRLLQYMNECGWITPLDALREFGCMRLAARIHDLKAQGHVIVDERVHTSNRYGDKVSFKQYRLAVRDPRQLDLFERTA